MDHREDGDPERHGHRPGGPEVRDISTTRIYLLALAPKEAFAPGNPDPAWPCACTELIRLFG
jgi:hypothetical protein